MEGRECEMRRKERICGGWIEAMCACLEYLGSLLRDAHLEHLYHAKVKRQCNSSNPSHRSIEWTMHLTDITNGTWERNSRPISKPTSTCFGDNANAYRVSRVSSTDTNITNIPATYELKPSHTVTQVSLQNVVPRPPPHIHRTHLQQTHLPAPAPLLHRH